ncbi:YceK/YidQ family lipoprotein [Tichowtungia aerotolerans]|uniref:YceK/YidQ family lipoprotein n=1 Tax=Tichowtungia aerotolerans TaxID=2697043 RepID=A0A6P1M3B5_9BACT|nr:YceK/YidQ family lipoprotein [Tichowtungia aerotolerans]QHI68337.1 YceK/YidQ family lipoprotein [Tichowtungia aerotolerans]
MKKILTTNIWRTCVCCIAMTLSGCAMEMIGERFYDPKPVGVYPSTRLDASLIHDSCSGGTFLFPEPNYWATPIIFCDLPFSVIADTLFLPADVIKKSRYEKNENKSNQSSEPTRTTPADEGNN